MLISGWSFYTQPQQGVNVLRNPFCYAKRCIPILVLYIFLHRYILKQLGLLFDGF